MRNAEREPRRSARHLLRVSLRVQPCAKNASAPAVLKDGRTIVYGAMGGDGQPQSQSAVFTRIVNFGMDPQAAVNAPRWLLGRTWGDTSETLKLKARFEMGLAHALMEWGTRWRSSSLTTRPWATRARSCGIRTARWKAGRTRVPMAVWRVTRPGSTLQGSWLRAAWMPRAFIAALRRVDRGLLALRKTGSDPNGTYLKLTRVPIFAYLCLGQGAWLCE
jgi:hypothetical protein